MGKFFLYAVTAIWTLSASAAEPRAIGRIISANKHLWPMKIDGSHARDVVVGGPVYEDDLFETSFRQSLGIEFEDKTKIVLGAKTQLSLADWNKRDKQGFLTRRVFLKAGLARVLVQKVYSQSEPFIVESPFGAVSVQGTEFVFEVLLKKAVELDVISGRVTFAKTVQALTLENEYVIVSGGRKSLVSAPMARPKPPLQFELAALHRLLTQNKMEFKIEAPTKRQPAEVPVKRRAQEMFKGGEHR